MKSTLMETFLIEKDGKLYGAISPSDRLSGIVVPRFSYETIYQTFVRILEIEDLSRKRIRLFYEGRMLIHRDFEQYSIYILNMDEIVIESIEYFQGLLIVEVDYERFKFLGSIDVCLLPAFTLRVWMKMKEGLENRL